MHIKGKIIHQLKKYFYKMTHETKTIQYIPLKKLVIYNWVLTKLTLHFFDTSDRKRIDPRVHVWTKVGTSNRSIGSLKGREGIYEESCGRC